MKIKSLHWMILFGVVLALLSCKKESEVKTPAEGDEYVTISATLDDSATKTYLDGKSVKWEASDVIKLWYGDLSTAMDGEAYTLVSGEGTTSATFRGFAPSKPAYMGVYPYSASNNCDKDGLLTVTLPTVQTATADSFGPGANVAVAYSTTTNLSFKNVGGLMAVTLTGTGGHTVKAMRLTGTSALSGKVEVAQATLPAITNVTDGLDYVELTGTLATGTYYFVTLPGSHTDFSITLIDTDGQTAVAKSTYDYTIERNSNTLIASLSPSVWADDAAVYINEVSATQIELYNPGVSAVDLSGWVLRCGERSWALLPGTTIDAGDFLIITAEQSSCATGPMFPLGSAGFTLTLENGSEVDSVTCDPLGEDETFGRKTDGSNEWVVFSTGSIGETNANGTPKKKVILINEVNCQTKEIELYNSSEDPVDLSGWTIYKQKASSDSPDSWAFSNMASTSIAPGGYLVITAGQSVDDNPDGPGFGISGSKGFILWLTDGGGKERDRINNGSDNPGKVTVPDGSTYGRVWDGSEDWMLFVGGSIGSANNGYAGIRLNEINGNDYNAENGNDKFVEIYNAGPNTVSLKGCILEKDGAGKWTGDDSHILAPDTYLVLYSNKAEGAKTCPAADVFSSGLSAKSAVRIQLFNPAGSSIDDFNLATKPASAAPASYGRNGDGVWYYQAATPGADNTDGDTPVTGLE